MIKGGRRRIAARAGGGEPSSFSGGRLAAAATVATALVGAVTGTTALWLDQRVDLEIEPGRATFGGQFLADGRLRRIDPSYVDLRVVNEGRRPVSLLGGEIHVRGRVAGHVTDALSQADPPVRTALPLTVPGESGARWYLSWRLAADARLPDLQGRNEERPPPGGEGRPPPAAVAAGLPSVPARLVLFVAPGGTRTYDIDLEEGTMPVRVPEPEAQPDVRFTLRRGRPVNVRVYAGVDREAAVARLRLWNDRSPRAVEAVERPLHGEARFPLPRLRRGRYEFVVEAGEDVVATGSFRVPCGRRHGSFYAYDLC